MTHTILHLSHTDTRVDARILRAMSAVSGEPGFEAIAVGIGASTSGLDDIIGQINDRHYTFFLPEYGNRKWRIRPGHQRSTRIRRSLKFLGVNFFLALFALRAVKGKRVSIVQSHDVTVLPAAAFLSLWKRAKLVYDAHELEAERTGISAGEGKMVKGIENFFWPKIDYLISVSPGIVQWYSAQFPPKPSVCILNAPALGDREQLEDPAVSLRVRLGIERDDVLFVYLGLFSPGRGIEKILDAFRSSDQNSNHVVFIGRGLLRKLIVDSARESGNVHVLDPVPHSDVVGYISSADYGLVIIEPISLSYELALPNKLFECAFAGLPVVASDNPEIRSVVSEYSLGVLVPPTKEGIIEGLASVKNYPRVDREGLTALGQEEQARKLRKVYSDVLGKSGLMQV